MDYQVTCMCKNGQDIAITKVGEYTTIDDLSRFIYGRWRKLNKEYVTLTFRVSGYGRCLLDNDEDLKMMFHLAQQMKLDRVDVNIQVNECMSESEDSDSDDELHPTSSEYARHQHETDLLPSFCQHKALELKGSGWCLEITDVGQAFKGGAQQFRMALWKYAVDVGFQYRFVKNDSERVTVVCSLHEVKGCEWHLHALRDKANDYFYIQKFNKMHTCGSVVRTSMHPRVNSKLIGSLLIEKIRKKLLYRAADVVHEIK